MNIYVGNLSLQTTEDDLSQAFKDFGDVISVNIVRDRTNGESRGFGFVSMPSKAEAEKAIEEMNGKDFMESSIKVEEGRMRTNRYRKDDRGRRQDSGGGRSRQGGFGGGGYNRRR
ncbi:RNA recognition motif domain-containing protein [Planctomycetota bacterium]